MDGMDAIGRNYSSPEDGAAWNYLGDMIKLMEDLTPRLRNCLVLLTTTLSKSREKDAGVDLGSQDAGLFWYLCLGLQEPDTMIAAEMDQTNIVLQFTDLLKKAQFYSQRNAGLVLTLEDVKCCSSVCRSWTRRQEELGPTDHIEFIAMPLFRETMRMIPLTLEFSSQRELEKSSHALNMRFVGLNEDLTLDYNEVKLFECMCRNLEAPPRTRLEDEQCFDLILSKVKDASNAHACLTLPLDEIRTFHFVRHRITLYETQPAAKAFDGWMAMYSRNNYDGSHCLDFKRDRNKDYACYLDDPKKFRLKLQKMDPTQVEQYAEDIFFSRAIALERAQREVERGGQKASAQTRDFIAAHQSLPRPKTLQDLAKEKPEGSPEQGSKKGEKSASKKGDVPTYEAEGLGNEDPAYSALYEVSIHLFKTFPEIEMDGKSPLLYSAEQLIDMVRTLYLKTHRQLHSVRVSLEEKGKAFDSLLVRLDNLRAEQGAIKQKCEEEQTTVWQKKIAAKDKTLADKQREIEAAGRSSHKREEELKAAANKAKSDADNLGAELEKARKEIDRIKELCTGKMQKLHDKFKAKNTALEAEQQAHEILKLDNDATLEALQLSEKENTALKVQLETQKAAVQNVDKLTKTCEDQRQLLQVAKTNQRIEADNIKRAVREASAPLSAEIEKLKQQVVIDKKEIQSLSQLNEEHVDKIIELKKGLTECGHDEVEELKQSLKKSQDELERQSQLIISKSTEIASAKAREEEAWEDRAKYYRLCGREMTKNDGLQAKLNRLEKKLAPFIAAAAALNDD